MTSLQLLAILLFAHVAATAQTKSQPVLGYRSAQLLTVNGMQFKDLNKNGKLDPYEDWRLSNDTRANDLLSKMSVEQKAGFMPTTPFSMRTNLKRCLLKKQIYLRGLPNDRCL